MRARFVGDPRFGGEGPETLNWLGVSFTKGKWAPVSAEIGARLSNNSHFEVEPFNGADPELFDHDGDGAAGGSLTVGALNDLAAVFEQAQAMCDCGAPEHEQHAETCAGTVFLIEGGHLPAVETETPAPAKRGPGRLKKAR